MELLCIGYRDSKKPIGSKNPTRQAWILPDPLGDNSGIVLGFFLCPILVDVVRVFPNPTRLRLMVGGKKPFQNQVGYPWGKMSGHEVRQGEVSDHPPYGHP